MLCRTVLVSHESYNPLPLTRMCDALRAGPFRPFTSRVKGQIRRARYYQTIIDTHEAETWTQQRDAHAGPAVQTSALMTEALAGVLDVKKKLRACVYYLAFICSRPSRLICVLRQGTAGAGSRPRLVAASPSQ